MADLEPTDQVNTAFNLPRSLEELERAGFSVFGGLEVQLLEGGITTEPSDFPIAILRVLRRDNDAVIHVNLDEFREDDV